MWAPKSRAGLWGTTLDFLGHRNADLVTIDFVFLVVSLGKLNRTLLSRLGRCHLVTDIETDPRSFLLIWSCRFRTNIFDSLSESRVRTIVDSPTSWACHSSACLMSRFKFRLVPRKICGPLSDTELSFEVGLEWVERRAVTVSFRSQKKELSDGFSLSPTSFPSIKTSNSKTSEKRKLFLGLRKTQPSSSKLIAIATVVGRKSSETAAGCKNKI